MPRIAVLASGSGSILNAILQEALPVSLVLTDRPCTAAEIAINAGVPTDIIKRTAFGYRKDSGDNWNRRAFTEAVHESLVNNRINIVAMAGFFTILHPMIFEDFGGKILNIHPSLLPAFKGASAVRDALAAGVQVTGTTIHLATETLDDHRYIIAQVKVAVHSTDTVESLWERIKVHERLLYPALLRQILEGTIRLEDFRD